MKLELEHHLAWFAHFEYARMLMRKGGPSNYELCKQHLDKVLEGKVVLGPTKGKGKVSMQNMAVIRANSTSESWLEVIYQKTDSCCSCSG